MGKIALALKKIISSFGEATGRTSSGNFSRRRFFC